MWTPKLFSKRCTKVKQKWRLEHLATLSVIWTLRHRRTRWLTVQKLCKTLIDLKSASLFLKLVAALAKVKAKTVYYTL